MNRSLRSRLTIAVIGVTAPLMAAFAFLLYQAVSDAVWENFDRQLEDDARVMTGLIEVEAEGIDLEFGPVAAQFASRPDVATRFQLWRGDGTPLFPANGLADAHVRTGAPIDAPTLWDGTLADGTKARFLAFTFDPRIDEEEGPVADVQPMMFALGRETSRVDHLLADLGTWFWMLGTGMVLAASGVAGFAVSRGLAPMHRVTQTLGGIDETKLDARVPTGVVPLELRPFVDRLNRLLTRLDDAFTRERQFSSDVAHELRTPLAVLRASIDLALSEEGLDASVHRRLQDMLVTIDETAHLVDDLLELARAEGSDESGDLTHAVDLHDMVDVQWRQVESEARGRGLSFENAIAPATYVESDPTRLRRIVANLFSNAAAYTEQDGWVRVDSDAAAGRILAVRDSGPPIPAEQRAQLFERFWRADAARTETGAHAGIGLALARAMARRLGHDLVVEVDGREVCFVLTAGER